MGEPPDDVGQIRIWLLRTDWEEREWKRLLDLLSEDEREKAGRFRFPRDQRRSVVTRGVLRKILGAGTGREAAELAFDYGWRGKPALRGLPGIEFNVSHSGDYALIGVSRGGAVGVDIEAMRENIEHEDLAQRFYSARENAWLRAQTGDNGLRGFYRLWTAKEALLKAGGVGISEELSRVEVRFGESGAIGIEYEAMRGEWFARELDLVEGYAAAVVRSGGTGDVVLREYRDD